MLKTPEEEQRVKGLLEQALTNIRQAGASDLWSYTREFELGELSVAETIVAKLVKELA